MLTVQEMAALPDDDPRKIVDRLRSQQTRAAASRRLVFDLTDEEAAEIVAKIIGPPEDPTPNMIERGQRVSLATDRALDDAQVHDIWQAMYDEWRAAQYALMVR